MAFTDKACNYGLLSWLVIVIDLLGYFLKTKYYQTWVQTCINISSVLTLVFFPDSFQLLQEIHKHYPSIHPRDDFYYLSFWLPGLHDYFQMVSF